KSFDRYPFLQAFAGIDFARIEVAARIELADVHPVEFAGAAAGPAAGADNGAIVAADDVQNVVGAIDHDEVVLFLVARRERDAPGRAGAARLGVEHELPHEAAVLAEDLDAIVGAVADIDEAVLAQRDAMHRIGELR